MKLLKILLLFSSIVFAQQSIPTYRTTLLANDIDLGTKVQSATPDTNTVELNVNRKYSILNSVSSSDQSNLYFPDNLELLADTNRFFNSSTIGDWTYTSGDSLSSNLDSTALYEANTGSNGNISIGINGLTTNQYYDFAFGWQEGAIIQFEDDCLSDNTGSWATTDATVTFDIDHYELNYVATTQYLRRGITALNNGSSYSFSVEVKDGTASSVSGNINIATDVSASGVFSQSFVTTPAWQKVELVFTANASNLDYINIFTSLTSGNYEIRNIKIYIIDSESQKVEQSIPTITINGTSHTLPATSSVRQDTVLSFVARGNNSDTITVSFSDTCKTKIDNSLKIDYDKVLITKDSTKNVPFIVDLNTVGNFSETITTDNTATNSNETVTVTWTVIASPNLYVNDQDQAIDTVDFGTVSNVTTEALLVLENKTDASKTINWYKGTDGLAFWGNNWVISRPSTYPIILSIPANTKDSMYVRFNPLVDGAYQDSLLISSTFSSSIDTVIFKGVASGVYQPTLAAITLDTTTTQDYIGLTWNDIENEIGYRIYEQKTGEASYTLIKTQTGTTYNYYNSIYHLASNFKVEAFNSDTVVSSNVLSLTKIPTGNVAYINSFASSGGSGSYASPFDAISDVSSVYDSYDKILLKGSFTQQIYLSSVSDLEIAVYDTLANYTVNPTSPTYLNTAVRVLNSSNITIKNIAGTGYWFLRADGTDGLVLSDLDFQVTTLVQSNRGCLHFDSSSDITLEYSSIVSDSVWQWTSPHSMDMIIFEDGTRNVWINHNFIRHSDHSAIDIREYWTGDTAPWSITSSTTGRFIFTDNHLVNDNHQLVQMFSGTSDFYFRDNLFERAGSGIDSTTEYGWVNTDRTVGAALYTNGRLLFRNNIVNNAGHKDATTSARKVFDNQSRFDGNGNPAVQTNQAIINNTFDHNWTEIATIYKYENATSYGYSTSYNSYLAYSNVDWVNNVFSNTENPNGSDLWTLQSTVSDVSIRSNVFNGSATQNIKTGSEASPTYYTVAQLNAGSIGGGISASGNSYLSNPEYIVGQSSAYGGRHSGNTYRRGTAFDNYGIAGSALIDGGTYLTTVANVNGTILTVGDAKYFFDGWGMTNADNIMVQGIERFVTDVDYDANTVTVSNPDGIVSGDYVYYVYSGSAPDQGAIEEGLNDVPTYSPTPVILAQPSNVVDTTGATITFSVTASLDGTLGYQWWKVSPTTVQLADDDSSKYEGSTSKTLTIKNLASGDIGSYLVEVKNLLGYPETGYWINSDEATLSINDELTSSSDIDTLTVVQSSDDMFIQGAAYNSTTDYLKAGLDGSVHTVGMIFTGMNDWTSIDSAKMIVTCRNNRTGTWDYNSRFENSGNPTTFSSYADFASRTYIAENDDGIITADWTDNVQYELDVTNGIRALNDDFTYGSTNVGRINNTIFGTDATTARAWDSFEGNVSVIIIIYGTK